MRSVYIQYITFQVKQQFLKIERMKKTFNLFLFILLSACNRSHCLIFCTMIWCTMYIHGRRSAYIDEIVWVIEYAFLSYLIVFHSEMVKSSEQELVKKTQFFCRSDWLVPPLSPLAKIGKSSTCHRERRTTMRQEKRGKYYRCVSWSEYIGCGVAKTICRLQNHWTFPSNRMKNKIKGTKSFL